MSLPATYYRILKLVQEPQLSSGVSTVTSADDMVRWMHGYLRRACDIMRSDHIHGNMGHLARRRKRLGPPRSFGRTFDVDQT